MEQDAIQIENALDNDSDSDPIVVASENLCKIAESASMFIGKPLEHLSDEKRQIIADRVVQDAARSKSIVKNDRLLTKAIVAFVQRECQENCGYIHL